MEMNITERRNVVWILVRASGFWLLILGLQMIPSLVLAVPEIVNILLSWELLSAHHSWQTLLSHGPTAHAAGILSKLTVYLTGAFYLIGRAEWLIALAARD